MMRKFSLSRFLAGCTETFGLGRGMAITGAVLIILVVVFAVFLFLHSAPPTSITITSGPAGSVFMTNAQKYATILARNGVKLKLLESRGSRENLERLQNPRLRVHLGFVQGGVTNAGNSDRLVSLGSLFYEPLFLFYRGEEPFNLLSELAGKRLAIGAPASGTRSLALTLLQTNGIAAGGATVLLDLEAGPATAALLAGTIDAAFFMSDSASSQTLRTLLRAPGIHLFDFTQADAYTRKIKYLNKLELPMGSIDFGRNIPEHNVHLIGPTVELVAREDLHPALSDLLLEAAREVHGGSSLLQRQGEFPAPIERTFPISADAERFYRSGKSWLYRSLPFWLASVVNRVLVVFVPMVVVLIPGLRIIPAIYRWRIRIRIHRWYRALLLLERDLPDTSGAAKREELLQQLSRIEKAVNKMSVPASFADQFYGLRGHISLVRDRLQS